MWLLCQPESLWSWLWDFGLGLDNTIDCWLSMHSIDETMATSQIWWPKTVTWDLWQPGQLLLRYHFALFYFGSDRSPRSLDVVCRALVNWTSPYRAWLLRPWACFSVLSLKFSILSSVTWVLFFELSFLSSLSWAPSCLVSFLSWVSSLELSLSWDNSFFWDLTGAQ